MFSLKVIRVLLAVMLALLSVSAPAPLYAQSNFLDLPKPGVMVDLSKSYAPVLLKGIKLDLANPLRFEFLLDQGDNMSSPNVVVGDPVFKKESERLIKYFLTCLTLPEEDLWVNLSPYEKDRMIEANFGATMLGRDMLAQDYVLKQLTASLIYPEKELGKAFWSRVYAKAKEKYGDVDIPVNTFNKVWILADEARVFANGDKAYILDAKMKVMLEEDYLAKEKTLSSPKAAVMPLASQVIKDIILPELDKEINTGTHFAPLRQMYHAFVLASWYKKNLKQSIVNQVYANKKKVESLRHPERSEGSQQEQPLTPEAIYQRYLQAYKKGVFNYIQEEPVIPAEAGIQTTARKYFSGGTQFKDGATEISPAQLTSADRAIITKRSIAAVVDLDSKTPSVVSKAMASSLDIEVTPASGIANNLRQTLDSADTAELEAIEGLRQQGKYILMRLLNLMAKVYRNRGVILILNTTVNEWQKLPKAEDGFWDRFTEPDIEMLERFLMRWHQWKWLGADVAQRIPGVSTQESLDKKWREIQDRYGDKIRFDYPGRGFYWDESNVKGAIASQAMTGDVQMTKQEMLKVISAWAKSVVDKREAIAKEFSQEYQSSGLKDAFGNYITVFGLIEVLSISSMLAGDYEALMGRMGEASLVMDVFVADKEDIDERVNKFVEAKKLQNPDFYLNNLLIAERIRSGELTAGFAAQLKELHGLFNQDQQRVRQLIGQYAIAHGFKINLPNKAMTATGVSPREQEERMKVAVRSLGHGEGLFDPLNGVSLMSYLNFIRDQIHDKEGVLPDDFETNLIKALDHFMMVYRAFREELKGDEQENNRYEEVFLSMQDLCKELRIYLNNLSKHPLFKAVAPFNMRGLNYFLTEMQNRVDVGNAKGLRGKVKVGDLVKAMRKDSFIQSIRISVDERLMNEQLEGDLWGLQVTLHNLVSNALEAIHASRQETGLPLLGEDAVEIRFVEADNGKVQIIVRDNGPGLKVGELVDELYSLTEAFIPRKKVFALDHSSKGGAGKKRGVGTTEAWYLIHDMGGIIDVHNRTDGVKGAEFVMTLSRVKGPVKHTRLKGRYDIAATDAGKPPGGIAFKANDLKLKDEGASLGALSAQGFGLSAVVMAQLASPDFNGFTPIIREIKPIADPLSYLGLSP